MARPTLKILVLHPRLGHDWPLPQAHTALSAGFDLVAAIDEPRTLHPGERSVVPCGFSMALPSGFEGQIRPRSGLALKHGLTCLNSPGTIDADYRGQVQVLLIHHGDAPTVIEPGMRIAQLVIAEVAPVVLEVVRELPDSARGHGGFGSTGT